MQIVSYRMEQKRIKENSRSEQIGILSASLSRRMPKPLGQLSNYCGPLAETFAEHQIEEAAHDQLQEYSMERTPVGDA